MKPFLRNLPLILLSIALTTPTHSYAKDYLKVEMIVFQTGALRGWTEERWPEIYDPLFFTQEETLTEFNLLKPQDLDLHSQIEKMTPEKGYTILSHFGWVQTAYSKDEAKYLYIDESFQLNHNHSSNIFGSIKAYKGRYNHAEINLNLERRIPNVIKERFAKNQQLDKEYLPDKWLFKIDESRRIKAGDLHYIDHPIFGVLIKITSL